MYHRTGGEIWEIEGLECHLPKQPKLSEISGYSLKKKDQKWSRTTLPENHDERRIAEAKEQEKQRKLVIEGKATHITYFDPVLERFRRQEWRRRLLGHWFMLNGKPIYLTGAHYFYLNWCKPDSGFPTFYHTQLKRFYFRQYCYEDPKCLGYFVVGQRGWGKSTEEIACMIENLTRPPHGRRGAIQSKNEDEAKRVLFEEKAVIIYNNLPEFFQPESNHGTQPKGRMLWEQKGSTKTENRRLLIEDFQLNNSLTPVSSSATALDSGSYADVLNDELGKTTEVDVDDRMQKNRFSVYRNNKKRGIIRGTTTIEDMDKGGGENAHKLWKKSDQKNRTPNGMTISGLYQLFIPASETTNKPEFVDDFGFIDQEKAAKFHRDELEARKDDPVEYNSYMRKNPETVEQAFIKDASKCIFNVEIITKRLREIEIMKQKPYIQGNFYWVNDVDGEVDFEEDKLGGRFLVSKLLSKNSTRDCFKPNRISKEVATSGRTIWTPQNDYTFGIGTDPIKYTKSFDPRSSRAGAHGFYKYDNHVDGHRDKKEWESHMLIFEYFNRPEDFDVYAEDMIMAMRYYGCSIHPEGNIDNLYQHLVYRGYENWVTTQDRFTDETISGKKDHIPVKSYDPVIDAMIRRMIVLVNEHGHRIPFPNTLKQLLDFEIDRRTKYDLVMSLGYTLLEAEKRVEEELPADDINDWLDTFDASGVKPSYSQESEEMIMEGEGNDDYFF
jgi:hypothetical protein